MSFMKFISEWWYVFGLLISRLHFQKFSSPHKKPHSIFFFLSGLPGFSRVVVSVRYFYCATSGCARARWQAGQRIKEEILQDRSDDQTTTASASCFITTIRTVPRFNCTNTAYSYLVCLIVSVWIL